MGNCCRGSADALRSRLEETRKQKADLAEQLEAAKQQISTSATKINDLSSASTDASNQLEAARGQLAGLQADFDKLQQSSRQQKSSHARELDGLRADSEGLLDAFKRKHDQELEQRDKARSDQLTEMRTDLTQSLQKVDQLQEQLAALNEDDGAQRNRIQAAQQEKAAALNRAEQLFKHSDSLEQQMRALRTEHQQFQDAASSKQASLNEHLEDVQKQRQDAVNELEDLRSTVASLRMDLQQASEAEEAARNDAQQGIERQQSVARAKLDQLRSERDQLRFERDSLQQELGNAQRASASSDSASQELQQLRSECESLRQQLSNAEQKAAAADKQALSKTDSIVSVMEERSAAADKAQALNMRIETLSQALQEARDEGPGSARSNGGSPRVDVGTQMEQEQAVVQGIPSEHSTATERAFAAAEAKVQLLTRELAAAKMNVGEQTPEVSELKQRIVQLQAQLDDKVCKQAPVLAECSSWKKRIEATRLTSIHAKHCFGQLYVPIWHCHCLRDQGTSSSLVGCQNIDRAQVQRPLQILGCSHLSLCRADIQG